jgi:ABC-type transport system involved in cytochrome bd biosynthesis fused ATPase/permease subunit
MKDENRDGLIDWHDRYIELLSPVQIVSVKAADVLFTPLSALVHTIWFVTWFAAGLSINLLTLIVSLEAIYITLFIGLGQNLQTKRDKVAQEQRDHMQGSIERLLEVNNRQTDDIHATVCIGPRPPSQTSSPSS